MPILAFRRLLWARQKQDAAGAAVTLAIPLVAAVLLASSRSWLAGAVFVWTLLGLVPAALNGRTEQSVMRRWRSLPVSTGDRWFAAFLAFFPISLVATEILAIAGMLWGPAMAIHPLDLAVAALYCAVTVMAGLAAAAWSRTEWQLAGWISVLLLVSGEPLLAGARGMIFHLVPAGQALVALNSPNVASISTSLIEMIMAGAAFAVLGILGYERA